MKLSTPIVTNSKCSIKIEHYKKNDRIIEEGNTKSFFLHDNAPSHTARRVKETIETFSWKILAHAAYSPGLAPSDYHLFVSLGHVLAEQRFTSYENVREWLDNWFDLKDDQFYWRGIHHLLERWKKRVNSNGDYFE